MGGGCGGYPASALGATPTRGIKHFLPVMEWRGSDCYTISVTGSAWYLLRTTPSSLNSSSVSPSTSSSTSPSSSFNLRLPQLISLDFFLNFFNIDYLSAWYLLGKVAARVFNFIVLGSKEDRICSFSVGIKFNFRNVGLYTGYLSLGFNSVKKKERCPKLKHCHLNISIGHRCRWQRGKTIFDKLFRSGIFAMCLQSSVLCLQSRRTKQCFFKLYRLGMFVLVFVRCLQSSVFSLQYCLPLRLFF